MIPSRLSFISAQTIGTEGKSATWLQVRVGVSLLCVTFLFAVSLFDASSFAEEAVRRVWINGGDGLRNGDFEHWVEGEPVFWKVSPEWKAMLRRKPDTPRKGSTVLGFAGNCADCSAATDLKFDRPPAGLTLLFTIHAKTAEPDSLRTFVEYDGMDGRSSSPQAHPGDGQWHILEQVITFPADFSETRIHVGFSYTSQSENPPPGFLANARVNVLPDVRNQRRQIIRDTQFQHWNDGVPAGWHVLKGKISRSIENSEGIPSLRLEAPGKPDGEAAKLQFPLKLYAIDAGKTLGIRFTTKGTGPALRHAIFGRVDGNMVPFAYGTDGKTGYTSIPLSAEWSETTTDFIVPENFGSLSALLIIQMNSSATEPIEIQHLSATVIPVDSDE